MLSTLAKASIIAGTLLLAACSGMNTSSCFSVDCQSYDNHSGNAAKLNFGGSAIGSSFSQYSEGLLHDD